MNKDGKLDKHLRNQSLRNLTSQKTERKALKSLQDDNSIIILPADIGNAAW